MIETRSEMGMEQKYQEQRCGSSTCLVCGRKGGNTIVVTNVHSFVSASGTPLSDFLVKVVGEDPCYSVSEVICQQCFVLLDRLDAYQARAAEILSHLTSRYKDTKLELLGQRKRMSELIANSLSNVQELRHGTTLNVSDELTITVVHEAYPKKGKNIFRLENGSSFDHFKTKSDSRYGVKEDIFSRLISQKLKKRKAPQPNNNLTFNRGNKRRKVSQNTPHASNNNNTTTHNNNICYVKGVKGQLFAHRLFGSSSNQRARKNPPRLVSEVKENSDEEEYASDESVREEDEESTSDVEASRDSVVEIPNGEKEKDEEEDNEQEEESSDESSSDSDDDDGSGDEDADEDKESEHSKGEKEEEEEIMEDEEEEEDQERMSAAAEDECETRSQRPESSLSQKSEEAVPESVEVKSEIKEEELEIEPTVKEEPNSQLQLQLPAGVVVPPQVAEAMLMQSPLATSLLQSFLATSLWFGSPDTPNKKLSGQAKLKQEQQAPDDLTREMLAVVSGSTKDKKKRQELKNTGQSYINTKGKLVSAKRVWPQDCSRCPLKCNARISEEERLKIFAEYWGLADYNLQREYLAAHMQREEKLGPSGLLRTVINYFLTQGKDKKLQVCRQFFLKTLDVSEKASRIVLEKMVRGELGSDSGGATSPLGIIRPLSAQGECQDAAKENDETSNMSHDDCEAKAEESS